MGAALAAGVLRLGGTSGAKPGVAMEMPLTSMNLPFQPSNNSPLLFADPTEPRFVVLAQRLDAPDFSCALDLSGDGGRRWAPANPVPQLPPGAEKCYAPEVAFDRLGRLYYLFVGLAGKGNEPMGAFLTHSDDRGRTFSPPTQVLGPLNFAVRMAIDPGLGARGRLHLVWVHATSDPGVGSFGPPPNPILASYSDDGGHRFSKPVQVSDAGRDRVVAPALVLGRNHQLHVAYYDLGSDTRDYQNLEGPAWEGNWSVILATSAGGGKSFGRGVVVDDKVVPDERVMLIFTMPPPALVANDGHLCAAWTDARNGDPDVLARCSSNDGRIWGRAVRVNDDRVGAGARQYLPRLGVAPNGRVDAIFFDRRLDRENLRNHIYYAYSTNGGKSFSRNLRVTRYPSETRIGQQYAGAGAKGQFEIGSRLGLLSRNESVVAAWPDTRNQTVRTTNQDLFATTITLPNQGQPAWARLLGVLMVLGGAALLGGGFQGRRRAPAASRPATAVEPHGAGQPVG